MERRRTASAPRARQRRLSGGSGSENGMQGDSTRLLVIEDDRHLGPLLTRQLHEIGFPVHLAADGVEGLELTREVRPEFVLCDWLLPRLDGLEYCRRVKSDPELQCTYVALLSGRNECRDRVAGLDAGADDFLTKPVQTPELLARVRAGLRIRRLQRELAETRHREALVELAATLGHEINNPLTALFGHLELILQYLGQSDRQRMQHHVRQAGEVAARIAEVGQKLISLHDPETTSYLGTTRMLDLDRRSSG